MSNEKKVICHVVPNWEYYWPTWARSLDDLLRFRPVKVISRQELEQIYPWCNPNQPKETNE